MTNQELTVRDLAIKVFGDYKKASNWYYTQKFSQWGGMTPSMMVLDGKEGLVRELLIKIDEGML